MYTRLNLSRQDDSQYSVGLDGPEVFGVLFSKHLCVISLSVFLSVRPTFVCALSLATVHQPSVKFFSKYYSYLEFTTWDFTTVEDGCKAQREMDKLWSLDWESGLFNTTLKAFESSHFSSAPPCISAL